MDLSAELSHPARLAHDFDRVAERYDLLNKLNPGYRKHLTWSARRLQLGAGAAILDLCCGTGLSTEALVASYPDATVTALDNSSGMLARARRKPALSRVQFVEGDALDPAAAGVKRPYDGILMAYGIRNVLDRDRCLQNLRRLLKPGGIIAFHEYSVADSKFAQAIWNTVARTVIVPMGSALTQAPQLFRYLRQSVNDFDGLRAFRARLERAGFHDVQVHAMDGWQRGVTHTFTARAGQSKRG